MKKEREKKRYPHCPDCGDELRIVTVGSIPPKMGKYVKPQDSNKKRPHLCVISERILAFKCFACGKTFKEGEISFPKADNVCVDCGKDISYRPKGSTRCERHEKHRNILPKQPYTKDKRLQGGRKAASKSAENTFQKKK